MLVLLTWSSLRGPQQQPESPEGIPAVTDPAARPGEEPLRAPGLAEAPAPAAVTPAAAPAREAPREPQLPEKRVTVANDLFRAELSSRGGTLQKWELMEFVDRSLPGDPPVDLVTIEEGDVGTLVTPFASLGLGDLSAAGYRVVEADSLHVVFALERDGIEIRKSYSFEADSYAYRLRIDVANHSTRDLRPRFAVRWRATKRELPDFKDQALIALADGGVERGRIDGLGRTGVFAMGAVSPEGDVHAPDVEWGGAELRYFLAVLVPEVPRDAEAVFFPVVAERAGDTILRYRELDLPAGSSLTREYRGYLGPKESERLADFGAGLDRSLFQGWAWVAPLAGFFAWMLHAMHAVIPNYGVAIILLTVLVRLVTAPLTAKQMKSMKRMGAIQPKLKELQEKYGDDKQRQSQEMMKLYKESGVNPLGGCLPMVLQLPVFIGLYYALQSSIDLRQEPFFGWITDLSRPETLFTLPGLGIPVRVLPLVMGASMVLQQRMTPMTTMDPAQARMMMTVMPVMFTVLFYQFPSGLVLYWMVSNLLAIAHQVWVNRSKESA
jgi:YidC/Oxa1 family membrane protein insertase